MTNKPQKQALVFGVKAPWDKASLPPDHFASFLAENGYHVRYVVDSISVFHFLKWGFRKSTMRNTWKLLSGSLEQNSIRYFSSFILFPEFKRNSVYRFLYKHLNFSCSSREMHKILRDEYELSWCSSYRNANLFVESHATTKLFSIEDNISGFNILPDERVLHVERTMQTGNIKLLCTSRCLIQEKFPEAIYYTNGLNENFKVLDFKNGPGSGKCVYVGALEEWFDWDLVNSVFSALEDKGFSLDIYGFSTGKVEEKIVAKNIRYRGSIENSRVQATLMQYDIGIIPFKINDLIAYVNPIKLYEYLASGLRVIATSWKELEALQPGCTCLSDTDSFMDYIVMLNDCMYSKEEISAMHEDLGKRRYYTIFDSLLKSLPQGQT